jgi:hypothetical protein
MGQDEGAVRKRDALREPFSVCLKDHPNLANES